MPRSSPNTAWPERGAEETAYAKKLAAIRAAQRAGKLYDTMHCRI